MGGVFTDVLTGVCTVSEAAEEGAPCGVDQLCRLLVAQLPASLALVAHGVDGEPQQGRVLAGCRAQRGGGRSGV